MNEQNIFTHLPSWFYKLMIFCLSFFAISPLSFAQCYTTTGNGISFIATAQNNDPDYGDLYILTDYQNIILDTTSMTNFPAQDAGLYNIYGVQYLSSQYPLVQIGSSISNVVGSCFNLSSPLEILVCPQIDTCNTFDGNFSFNTSGGNTDFVTSYILTDKEKNILQVNSLPSFSTIDTGVFLIFALNYIDITGLVAGSHIDNLVSACLDLSNPLVIRSCETCNVFLGDDFELCFPQTVLLTASSTYLGSYSWSTGQTGAMISVSPSATTTYMITFTALNGCQIIDEITINVNFPPTANAGIDKNICSGQSVILTADLVPDAFYQWSNGLNTRSITVSPNITQDYTVTVTVGDCSSEDIVQVLVSECGAVSGLVWEDLNANGIFEVGEGNIPNSTVRLFDNMGTQVALTFSDMMGNYVFSDIVPGDYSVMFDRPLGFEPTVADIGGDENVDSDANPNTGITTTFMVLPSDTISNIYAGYFRYATVGDFVWEDSNKNGIQDIGEAGIDQSLVRLIGVDGRGVAVDDNVFTDIMGQYNFLNVVPGNYTLVFDLPNDSFRRSPDNIGIDDARDSDADGTDGTTSIFSVLSGENTSIYDAGFYRCAYIGDYVWLDNGNESNVQDDTDLGLDGIVIYLYDASFPSQALDTTISTISDGFSGFYSFEVCDVGDYFIKVGTQEMYDLVMPNEGVDADKDSDITDRINGQSDVLNISYALSLNNIDIGFQFKPLPIDLVDFYGIWNKKDNSNYLYWKTASELNIDYFEIMRSVNGEFFESIKKVKAKGSSNSEKLYELTDDQIQQNGLYLYQLISYDFDGSKEISKPISIWVDNPFDIKLRLYPNPASTLINVEIEHYIESVGTVEIFDMVGRNVFAIKDLNQLNETTQQLSLDISGLSNGIYYIKLNLDGEVFTKKILIQR
ncbi:MAG TPA: SdrD B-like domain-containing protein [Saprospiraceae bacterium]|nr:SdrD B-like domain-containing protein [Saprospiraceae bacterium]